MPVNPLEVNNPWQLLALIVIMTPGVLAAYLAYKANAQAKSNGELGIQTHQLINSRLSELVAATKIASYGEGHAAGVAEGQKKSDDRTDKLAGTAAPSESKKE